MKVFISWSGELSKKLADILRQWLPAVIQAVKPYYSPDDLTKGTRWNTEIAKELEESKVGLICITRENLEAPWIMFEAGALSKNIGKARVCPILFGVDPADLQGPLVQFQAAKFEKEDIKKVINMVNAELGDKALTSDVVEQVFEMWWPRFKENVESALKSAGKTVAPQSRSDRAILEEILELTRGLAQDVSNVGFVPSTVRFARPVMWPGNIIVPGSGIQLDSNSIVVDYLSSFKDKKELGTKSTLEDEDETKEKQKQ